MKFLLLLVFTIQFEIDVVKINLIESGNWIFSSAHRCDHFFFFFVNLFIDYGKNLLCATVARNDTIALHHIFFFLYNSMPLWWICVQINWTLERETEMIWFNFPFHVLQWHSYCNVQRCKWRKRSIVNYGQMNEKTPFVVSLCRLVFFIAIEYHTCAFARMPRHINGSQSMVFDWFYFVTSFKHMHRYFADIRRYLCHCKQWRSLNKPLEIQLALWAQALIK